MITVSADLEIFSIDRLFYSESTGISARISFRTKSKVMNFLSLLQKIRFFRCVVKKDIRADMITVSVDLEIFSEDRVFISESTGMSARISFRTKSKVINFHSLEQKIRFFPSIAKRDILADMITVSVDLVIFSVQRVLHPESTRRAAYLSFKTK
jgi:hypothetical protein